MRQSACQRHADSASLRKNAPKCAEHDSWTQEKQPSARPDIEPHVQMKKAKAVVSKKAPAKKPAAKPKAVKKPAVVKKKASPPKPAPKKPAKAIKAAKAPSKA